MTDPLIQNINSESNLPGKRGRPTGTTKRPPVASWKKIRLSEEQKQGIKVLAQQFSTEALLIHETTIIDAMINMGLKNPEKLREVLYGLSE